MTKFFLLLLFFASGCISIEIRKPLNKSSDYFLKHSAQRNRLLLADEQNLISKVIDADTIKQYIPSKKGFWYYHKNKKTSNSLIPKKGDLVEFTYSIAKLNGEMLYDSEILGSVSYQVDEEDILPALREGVKLMKVGEVVVFLFPSYLCYSYQGDGEKIGINQPLKFEISLNTIVK